MFQKKENYKAPALQEWIQETYDNLPLAKLVNIAFDEDNFPTYVYEIFGKYYIDFGLSYQQTDLGADEYHLPTVKAKINELDVPHGMSTDYRKVIKMEFILISDHIAFLKQYDEDNGWQGDSDMYTIPYSHVLKAMEELSHIPEHSRITLLSLKRARVEMVMMLHNFDNMYQETYDRLVPNEES